MSLAEPQLVEQGKYIDIWLTEKKEKTLVYDILTKSSNIWLGQIRWYAKWRQYCFFPEKDTLFSRGCLCDISNFILKLTDERRTG